MNTSTQLIDRDKLIEKLNESYETRDEELELLVSINEDTESPEGIAIQKSKLEARVAALKEYFETIADIIYAAGAFDTKDEARKAITINEDDRQPHLGPDGVVPDDGLLWSRKRLTVFALQEPHIYRFQAPLADHVSNNCRVEFSIDLGNVLARITPDYKSIEDLGRGRENYYRRIDGEWLWVDGTVTARNFATAREISERVIQEVQASLLLFRVGRFRGNAFAVPPPKTIGRNKTYNTGVYVNSIAARLAPQILIIPEYRKLNEIDKKRKESELLDVRLNDPSIVQPSERSGATSCENVLTQFRRLE